MFKRTHSCGELSEKDLGKEACIAGWVDTWRDHGGLVFIDLRDREGVTQIVFNPKKNKTLHTGSRKLRTEYVIAVKGLVEPRPKGTENTKLKTGKIEIAVDEMEILRYKYKKKYLEFVDDNWNIDPKWSNSFADSYKERGMDVKWFGFMRADLIMRDEKMGIFKKLVDSGLVKLCIGVERPVDKELNSIGKKAFSSETTKKCFHLLRDKYPQIFRQGTFIVGTRDETTKSMLDVVKYAKEIDADYPSFHPITPIPGTTLWAEAKKNDWIEVKDFSKYDWLTPIMPSKYLSRDEIEDNIFRMNREFVNAKWLIRGLLSKGAYKRNMYLWWLVISMRMLSDAAKEFLLKPVRKPVFLRYVKPSWYDS